MISDQVESIREFLHANPVAGAKDVAGFVDRTSKALIHKGLFKEASALMTEFISYREASAKKFSETWKLLRRASPAPHIATDSGNLLPKGISIGKTAAILAGVGFISAGIYAALHQRGEQQSDRIGGASWVDRIEQERRARAERER